jgi:2-haloacid dehalogenase
VAIRQVFFDLNGTLLDPAAMGAPLRGRDAEQTAKDILREAVMLSMAETLTGSYRDFSQLLRAAAERHLTLAGEWDRLDEVTSASQRMWPFPDAATSIETLRWVGIGAGVLTNSSSAAATSLLARAELELEPVLGTDQVHAFKPDPRVYRLAVEAAGSAASEVALITAHGWDAIGAKRAGLRAAWVSRQEGVRVQLDPDPDFDARDLADAARQIAAASERG